MEHLHPDSLLDQEIDIVTSVISLPSFRLNPMMSVSPSKLPFKEHSTKCRVIGVLRKPTGFESFGILYGISIPLKTAQQIPHLGFSSIWSLLKQMGKEDKYSSIYVRVKNIDDLDPVKEEIKSKGYEVFSLADELEEIKRGFIILDMVLGAVGTIALFVASLGIINTMVMSILERTREIGVMKAIGGSDTDIQSIFITEAGTIGFLGGIFGLLLGWGVTRIANLVANYYIRQQGGPEVDFFYIPFWLIIGALAFSILVSLLAGLYPALRAAKVDPVRALRHD
jgi:ABC-type antimicrobial peptide transport system permease subunit